MQSIGNILRHIGEGIRLIVRYGYLGLIALVLLSFVYNLIFGSKSAKTARESSRFTERNGTFVEVKKSYWPDGTLKEETPYKIRLGLGYKSAHRTLIPHGVSKEYYADGTLKAEDPYIDGEREGYLKFYDKEGRLVEVQEYHHSKKNGLQSRLVDLGGGEYIEKYETYRDDVRIEGPDKRIVSAETLRQRYGKLCAKKKEGSADNENNRSQTTR